MLGEEVLRLALHGTELGANGVGLSPNSFCALRLMPASGASLRLIAPLSAHHGGLRHLLHEVLVFLLQHPDPFFQAVSLRGQSTNCLIEVVM